MKNKEYSKKKLEISRGYTLLGTDACYLKLFRILAQSLKFLQTH